jgi:phage gp45-like
MMDRFFNALKSQSAAQDAGLGQPRFGTVTSVDPTRPAVRVSIQPEGVVSGWLPVLSPWIGAGWGMSCPPSPGDQVVVLAHEGHAEHGIVIGRAWSDQAQTPQAPSGELWLVHQTGAYLKLTSDGTIRANGDLYLTGNIFATGNVSDGSGSIARLRQHYDAHVHGGGPTTSQPD